MLALLERAVSDAGGSYAFCDTDSFAIVASRRGGPVACEGGAYETSKGQAAIKALSWPDVERIRTRFTRLNPYGLDSEPESILELEKENFVDPKTRTRQRGRNCSAAPPEDRECRA